jgi:hypothetical protein
MFRSATVLLVTLGSAGITAAQESRSYAGGSLMRSSQGTAPICGAGSGCRRPAVGGSAWGVTADVGRFVRRGLGVGLEISLPERFETIQRSAIPTERIDNHHRDLAISGVLRVPVFESGPARVAVTGGGGFVQESTVYRSASAPFNSDSFGSYGMETTTTRWTVGATAGAEAAVDITRHISVVPQIRMHLVRRSYSPLGLATLIWQPGIGVRATF